MSLLKDCVSEESIVLLPSVPRYTDRRQVESVADEGLEGKFNNGESGLDGPESCITRYISLVLWLRSESGLGNRWYHGSR